MSGLWNFSVRVQSWSDKIESDPVLIRKIFENHQSDPVLFCQCKIMYLYFASWGKTTTGAIVPFVNYDWLKAKQFQQCFCIMRQNWHRLLALPKFNKEVSIRLQMEKHCWSYFAIWRIRLFGLVKWQGRYTWSFCIWWQNIYYHLANLWNRITTKIFYIFRIITLKLRQSMFKFSLQQMAAYINFLHHFIRLTITGDEVRW